MTPTRALLAGLAALATLSGCGSNGTDPIVREMMKEVGGLVPGMRKAEPEKPAAPARPVTRADIQKANVAAIFARLENDQAPTLMYAVAQNGPYVTYVSPFMQQVTLLGSQVTGTRGLGTDLLSAWSSGRDPLAHPTPPASWPASVQRTYELPGQGPRGKVVTYQCRFERGATREIVILQVRHAGVEMSETCTGPDGTFENLHFADAGSGLVWRSLQWVGPQMPLIDIQVIDPYTGG